MYVLVMSEIVYIFNHFFFFLLSRFPHPYVSIKNNKRLRTSHKKGKFLLLEVISFPPLYSEKYHFQGIRGGILG